MPKIFHDSHKKPPLVLYCISLYCNETSKIELFYLCSCYETLLRNKVRKI